jgi:hypothetical protein
VAITKAGRDAEGEGGVGQLTSDPGLEILNEAAARQIVADAVTLYVAGARSRIPGFVDQHFTARGSLRVHRTAVGWDLARAPVNLMLAVPQVAMVLAGEAAARTRWPERGEWLRDQRILLTTDVARELDWLIHSDLLRLPYSRDGRVSAHDALADEIFADPRIEAVSGALAEALGARAEDPSFRGELERKLTVYAGTRAAAAEITTAMLSLAAGAAAFKKLTPGVISLGPALAAVLAQQAAIAIFPLGAGLGGVWCGAFPSAAGPAMTAGVTGGLALSLAVLSAFSGVVFDPVQRRMGLHQRRLDKLVGAVDSDLKGDVTGNFVVRDHYVARVLDLADLLRATWRALA